MRVVTYYICDMPMPGLPLPLPISRVRRFSCCCRGYRNLSMAPVKILAAAEPLGTTTMKMVESQLA